MRLLIVLIVLLGLSPALAQNLVVTTCGTLPQAYAVGSTQQPTVDINGRLCTTNKTNPGYVAGRFYPVGNAISITNQVVPILDTVVFLVPFTAYDDPLIATSLNTVSVTGAVNCGIKMAVWGTSATTKRPTGLALAGSNTSQACTGSPQNASVTISFTFKPGTIYWAGTAVTTAAAQFMSYRTDLTLAGIGSWGELGQTTLNQNPVVAVRAPYTFATDIMALDLTSATFTDVTQLGVPIMYIGN